MKAFDLTGIVRENILRLKSYASARSEYSGAAAVMLDANENAFGDAYARYPDPLQRRLKARVAVLKRVSEDRIFIGNGSDEAIDLLIRSCCRPGSADHILICPPSYGMYEVSAAINDVAVRSVPLTASFQLDLPAVQGAMTQDTRVVFICSPNNPTGNRMQHSDIEAILSVAPGLVVIDEAYVDFSNGPSWSAVLDRYPNLVVLQTCSKAWGLAGLRIGMAFADPALVAILNKVKPPYNVPASSQELALAALQDTTRYEAKLAAILAQRDVLQAGLAQVPCVLNVFPSDANFLLVRVSDADALYRHLLSYGIVTRNRNTTPGCAGCIRITVGTESENRQLITSMNAFSA